MAVTESATTTTATEDSSAVPDSITSSNPTTGQKRSSTAAGNSSGTNFRPVKRRASKACQCCRARKVRCNVVEHGAPCTNCRLDEVECIITESKRRKKLWGTKVDSAGSASDTASAPKAAPAVATAALRSPSTSHHPEQHHHSPSAMSVDGGSDREGHVPHMIYQAQSMRMSLTGQERERRASYASSHGSVPSLTNSLSTQTSMTSTGPHRVLRSPGAIPPFIKPTPTRIPPEDLEYLTKKGALTLPAEPLRSELLKSHFDFVHPYMPLLNRREFLDIVTSEDGSKGKVSLLLFQAVMFTGSAFVDMDSLRIAGFTTRKAARKAFFTKVRALYDFDHEQDRMSLVQTLLLMTYWYETPDDQKDTWHWMGVAISLCHTIGLHRNPENSNMDPKRKKLWKRIWWSCFMRDRLVALGMRRPTRIKCEDCDVPMLTLDDFSIDMALEGEEGEDSVFWSYEQREQREKEARRQRELAIMCIEKAKLCVCISQVLSAQYSVLNTNQGSLAADGSTRTTMMLLPKKLDPECCQVARCDSELAKWIRELPEEARYSPNRASDNMDDVLTLHRNLLHMVYCTTVSALHRPQVLPSAPAPWPAKNNAAELQEVSRRKVRQAASEITRMAEELIELDLVKYLPTTGVTVMLPAVIIHLLDIKSSNALTRELSLEGFGLCMQVMQGLRQSYSAADYATHFLEAAIKKADIQVHGHRKFGHRRRARHRNVTQLGTSPGISGAAAISIPASAPPSNAALTPPPDLESLTAMDMGKGLDENDLQFKLESFLQAPPSPSHDAPLPSAFNVGSNGNSTLQAPAPAGAEDLLFSDSTPHLSMPADGGEGTNDLDALLNMREQGDPFLGHYDDAGLSGLGSKNATGGRAFDLMGESSSWLEEDMSKLLDGVDFDIDDVIQVLETEIN
ncbi:uncharacterized protein LAJ45_05978 [Morchella importuna]|uniref:uncharacterized protein n=1 Tax=Morchella importuna TaxID=1174673 RepID=UPI001E8D0969|nr:uncharacterized protein LAJ45_05978 [Morchella importuna]KAH8149826.1 hypothetical protein LAJ45_05978 [Morchella importuna]